MPTLETLAIYWSGPVLAANILVTLHLLGALLLGMVVGYERSYHGRAAGMRTYGLVCLASCALTVIGGYSQLWFGGAHVLASDGDTTRVIQGIVTGIGFLCAGVIMRVGFNISGLTTAASLWASSVIGILVGVGFFPAAIGLALLCAFCMAWIVRLETWLPSRQAVAITLKFRKGYAPQEPVLRQMTRAHGYDIASGTIAISLLESGIEWRFVAIAGSRKKMRPISELAQALEQFDGVAGFHTSYARN